jgi:hypothetical protein
MSEMKVKLECARKILLSGFQIKQSHEHPQYGEHEQWKSPHYD